MKEKVRTGSSGRKKKPIQANAKKDGDSKKAYEMFADVESDLEKLEASNAVRKSDNLSKRLEYTEHKLGKLETLLEITRSLNSTLNLNELLEMIMDSIIKLADTDRGFLMLADKAGDLQFRIARDRERSSLEQTDFAISYTIVNEVKQKGEPLFVSDLSESERFKNQESVLDLQLRTAVCVPLMLDDKVIGVIYTDSSRITNEFTISDLPIVTAFAAQTAVAIENAKLHGEVMLSRESLARENLELKERLSEKYEFDGIIGKSKAMQDIFSTIKKVAPLDTTILIQGETGTGKELIARAIHFNGGRKTNKLVTINCGAMPQELLESELFGHKRGAFTGATSDKAGLFETANEGTVFLDEIGDMPQPLQVKLLRALQDGEIRRVGENIPRKVDVRIIAATNRDLSEDIRNGNFRHDLFYRLNVVPITIPPLRDRAEDILPLIEHFLEMYCSKMKKGSVRMTAPAIKLLLNHMWDGNVRELENTVERALALCGDSKLLSAEHFPQLDPDSAAFESLERHKSLKEKLHSVEKQIIIDTLNKTEWNITKAAEVLEVTRQHLHNKIKQYNISQG
jgi:Nif-specific regulatory protein